MKTRPVRVHVPVDSGSRTHDGQRICEECSQPWSWRAHDLSSIPDTSELDARRIGESGE